MQLICCFILTKVKPSPDEFRGVSFCYLIGAVLEG
jgi:hypothetical protein